MSDWAPGDLALCVSGGEYVRTGAVYTVADVVDALWEGGGDAHEAALILAEASNPENVCPGFPRGPFWHGWFRKIEPHTPDAEDLETIELYRRELIPLSPHRENLRRATLNSNCGPAAFSQPVHLTEITRA